MMPTERSDQPSRVSVEDIPRAPDEHVTTSDLRPGRDGPRHPGDDRARSTAAATPHEEQSADDQPAPAAGDDEATRQRRRRNRRPAERVIARQTAQLSEARAKLAEQEVRLAELEAKVNTPTPKPASTPEPKLTDPEFKGDPRGYAKAWAEWDTKNRPEPPPAPRATRAAAESAPQVPDEAPPSKAEIDEFHQRGAELVGADRWQDLQETKGVTIDGVMSNWIVDHEEAGTKVYVHLLENPEVANAIAAMKEPAERRAALRKLEKAAKAGELESDGEIESEPLYNQGDDEEDEPEPAPRTRKTRAPTPPSDTRPSGNAPIAPRLDKLSMDDYAETRRREIAKRTGRSY